ncbi:uncharacterized protein [Watersipora subatra]|uniref:uncharacterized protein n=1 Tax=Watersipora subatra TaxID=2589382 RepID=UPI00355AEFED
MTMSSISSHNDITTRTWTHIKVLYTLVCLLSAVTLALFVVCFMMLLEVRESIENEITVRQEREDRFVSDVYAGKVSSQSSEGANILTTIDINSEKLIAIDEGIQLSASTLTEFCVSIHAHCPLRGPPGNQGERGVKGDRGSRGSKGDQGERGSQGPRGLAGLSIEGQKGEIGVKGDTGLPGHDGRDGLPGAKGDNGQPGRPGLSMKAEKGEMGNPGIPGDTGEPGVAGPQGLPGQAGLPGVPGCKGQKGEKGWLSLYNPCSSSCGRLSGPIGMSKPGEKGEKGEPGAMSSGFGLKGQKGSPGIPGVAGKNGLMGLPGVDGVDGLKGAKGDPGIAGNTGSPGLPGVPGLNGSEGIAGPPGIDGFKGDKGEAGADMTEEVLVESIIHRNLTWVLKGEPGDKGVVGPPGEAGRRGKRGHKGEPGEVIQCECLEGPRGEKGDPGVCPRPTPIHLLFQNSTIPEKKEDLTIKKIGKPVLYRKLDSEWGAWMVDSDPTDVTNGKVYITTHFTGRILYEYSSIATLISTSGNYSKQYVMQDQYYGTGGVVYRGGFYFHRAGLSMIARYDLKTLAVTAQLTIDDALHRSSQSLFSTDYNYFDLAVDENGLWVAYAFKERELEEAYPNSLLVAKLEPNYLDIEKTWNVTVMRGDYANSFIAHGILYLLDSATDRNAQLSFIYDLYSNSVLQASIPFTNVFGKNRMLAYDFSNTPNIMVLDNGRIVSYPILAD